MGNQLPVTERGGGGEARHGVPHPSWAAPHTHPLTFSSVSSCSSCRLSVYTPSSAPTTRNWSARWGWGWSERDSQGGGGLPLPPGPPHTLPAYPESQGEPR